MAVKSLAIISEAVARRFAKEYSVALLSNSPQPFPHMIEDINNFGGNTAFRKIASHFPGALLAAAAYNPPERFREKRHTKHDEYNLMEDFHKQTYSNHSSGEGVFNFARHTLPLLRDAKRDLQYPPTLLITGSAASVTGFPRLASYSAGKFAIRGLAHSLAREDAPQGIHVAHIIAHGRLEKSEFAIERYTHPIGNARKVADTYWDLHVEKDPNEFTLEYDLRDKESSKLHP
ncbi:hypothetical protein P170DRAFT_443422 [Aspergillus steynii IBT 23096]|uniref:NAD(P)-binding protein n=1 Tax=Aspergillus steynii IBT 23096 TaxID=1392250 RepID=A0A2I2GS43_9EURO|nr:uncharacterized protein P170DRAFT_443422 [Aspergillus steynii IBT 23096]PLB55692.1 hypothetical protein P170DRAFT_443422 [Aspergillus steynii IBT 23096]